MAELGVSELKRVDSSPHDSFPPKSPGTADHASYRPETEDQCSIVPPAVDSRPEGMSKNQWKKVLRQQQREEQREEWKRIKKEKDKEKRRKRKLEGHSSDPPFHKKKKKTGMLDGGASSVRVVIDLGYEHLMNDKDITKLMKQCQRCYAVNRRAETPLQLHFTSFGGRCKKRMDSATPGYVKWDVHFASGSYVDEFGRNGVVFLAAESPNILTDLDPGKVYVIGGLVDHNHHKVEYDYMTGHNDVFNSFLMETAKLSPPLFFRGESLGPRPGYCYQCAVENGVAHAQLPISQYIKLNSRNVLAVNHVFEILLAFVKHKNWELAFYEVVPQRKIEAIKTSIVQPDPDVDPGNLSTTATEEVQSQDRAIGSEDDSTDKERNSGQFHLETCTTLETKFEKKETGYKC